MGLARGGAGTALVGDAATVAERINEYAAPGDAISWKSAPTVWAGVGLARGGAGTALVGDAATVAERINEYAAPG
ncbi:hypothetical protein CKF46_36600, partial [Klebsiella pneumoniae]